MSNPAITAAFNRYHAAWRVRESLRTRLEREVGGGDPYRSRFWRPFSRACDITHRLLVALSETEIAEVRAGRVERAS
jgi:hypothetical protein